MGTSPTRATGFSPFKLLFGDKAMTPGELAAKSLRTGADHKPADRGVSLDLLEENRVQTITTMTRYVVGVTAAYNKKVRIRHLAPGDMVLKRVAHPTAVGKLESKWEGPYIITRTTRVDSYYIATPGGQQLDHRQNTKSLRKFYP